MNILFLAHRIPYPPNKGDKIRSFNELRYLSRFSNVFLAALVDDPNDNKYETNLHDYCREIHLAPISPLKKRITSFSGFLTNESLSVKYFHSHNLQRKVNRILAKNNFDAIFCFSSTMAEYIYRSEIFQNRFTKKRPKLVMDFCDMDSMKWNEYAQKSRWPLNLVYHWEWKKLAAYETKITKDFDVSLFVSQREQALFENHNPHCKNIKTMSNGVDLNYFSPNHETITKNTNPPPEIVFTGAMDYQANIDGVLWFYEKIWPIIHSKLPEATFTIVGSNPAPTIQKLSKTQNITVTGFVDDIRPYYQRAVVCAVPLRVARGIQNKVLEGMAMGKAIVCTPNAAEGITGHNNHGLFCERTPDNFAQTIIKLCDDKPKREEAGIKNRQYVEKHFDWDTNLRVLKKIIIKN